MEEVFAEERSFAVQHVFMPAVVYYYLQNIYKFYTIIFLFESMEYLLGQLDHNWSETPGDSLVGDILMATLGMLAIRQFKYESKPLWYFAIQIVLLALASVVTVKLLWDKLVLAYVLYASVVTATALFISIDWAMFSLVNVVIIATIATQGFTSTFSHTPIATIISLSCTTVGLILCRWLA